jgi:hypothetical protein
VDELQQEFHVACERATAECRQLGYVPSAWIGMIERHGAVEAAKRLLVSGDLQPGLLRLLRLGRSDLTIEHAVLQDRWLELFNDQDRELAQWRLAQAEAAR